jgi:hypothetical protein
MKAASIVFEGLDATVEGFAQSIGNAMFDVSQQADEVALEGLRHSHHRLYTPLRNIFGFCAYSLITSDVCITYVV